MIKSSDFVKINLAGEVIQQISWFSDKIGNFKIAFSKIHTHTHNFWKYFLKRLGEMEWDRGS